MLIRLDEKEEEKGKHEIVINSSSICSPLHVAAGIVSLGLQTTSLPFIVFHLGTNFAMTYQFRAL